MKKKILGVILALFFLTGCNSNNNKYDNFEHYDLKNHVYKEFSYVNEDKKTETYAIAVLSKKDEQVEGYEEGLFYKVDNNDYILIDSYIGDKELIENKKYTQIYNDKIYVIRQMGVVYEFSLNKENSKMKELKFNTDKMLEEIKNKPNYKNYDVTSEMEFAYFTGIEKIENNYIYFNTHLNHIIDYESIAKCSLKEMVCEEKNKK